MNERAVAILAAVIYGAFGIAILGAAGVVGYAALYGFCMLFLGCRTH
jgi:hypothetical protein